MAGGNAKMNKFYNVGAERDYGTPAVTGAATGPVGHECQRGSFVEQAQLAGGLCRILAVRRVGEDAATQEVAMEVGHQRADVA